MPEGSRPVSACSRQVSLSLSLILIQHVNRLIGIHAAAKETISLAEERFRDNSGEWTFDNAWQEMLNHATIKVTRQILEHLEALFRKSLVKDIGFMELLSLLISLPLWSL